MVLDNPIGDRQPKACPLADIFGGEKGIEDMGHVVGGNTDAVIRDRYTGVASWAESQSRGWLSGGTGDGDGDLATVGHGLPGIRDEIDQHLLHLPRIDPGADRCGIGRQRQHRVVLYRQRSEHVEGMVGQGPQIYRNAGEICGGQTSVTAE